MCDYLIDIGACSAYVVDADRGTSKEEPIFDEPGMSMMMKRTTSTTLTTTTSDNDNINDNDLVLPIWNRCNVTAHFPSSTNLDFVLELLQESTFFTNSLTSTSSTSSSSPTTTTISGNTAKNQQKQKQQQQPIIHHIERVPNKDWIIHVQQGWKPIIVANRFILRFPWHDDTMVNTIIEQHYQSKLYNNNTTTVYSINLDQSNKEKTKNNQQHHPQRTESLIPLVPLKLQGGVAFGTGEHATTQLCLQWLGTILDNVSQNDHSSIQEQEEKQLSLVDYGSGSGILGLGACAYGKQLGINITSIGIDIDIDSCYIANENAINNNILMNNYLPSIQSTIDDESKSLLLKALAKSQSSSTVDVDDNTVSIVLPELYNTKQYDICVANILATPLVTLAPTLAQLTKPNGGQLGLSGILSYQADTIIHAYTNAGFYNVQVSNQIDDWILITGIRK